MIKKDYSITLRDIYGKTHELFINADCINEQINAGISESVAVLNVEHNACLNAISQGAIDENCWIEATGAAA